MLWRWHALQAKAPACNVLLCDPRSPRILLPHQRFMYPLRCDQTRWRLLELCGVLLCPGTAAPLQVRASLFAAVVGGLGQCAALRHVEPEEPLWQQAAAGLVSVVNAGLPAVNIMFVNHHQPPEHAWQVRQCMVVQFCMVISRWQCICKSPLPPNRY